MLAQQKLQALVASHSSVQAEQSSVVLQNDLQGYSSLLKENDSFLLAEDDGRLFESDQNNSNNQQQLQQHEEQQHYHLSSIESSVAIRQLRSQGLSFQLWPAASSLVSLLDTNHSALLLPTPATAATRPLRILEIGSGTGLVGIAAAAILRAHVTLTDLPHVLPNLRFNAESNAALVSSCGGWLEVHQLRWGEDEDSASLSATAEFDAVLASDIVYYDYLVDPLLQSLRVFVKGEVPFIMAHLRRWKKTDSAFFRKAKKLFDIAVLRTDPPLSGNRVGVTVYRFTAKRRRASSTTVTMSENEIDASINSKF